jgi:ABC-type branched-subunit amino acid transport system substrate-binding protein
MYTQSPILNKHNYSQLLLIVWIVLFYSGPVQSQTNPPDQGGQSVEPASVLKTPVDFTGWKGPALPPNQFNEIRIGLFAPDRADDPVGKAMLNAAALAIEEANAAGGFRGVPFRLVNRWAYDPWGAGSKEMIKLIYQDSVWAVIGSIDGAATHVAEQIVAKARVPLLSPVSADPTLTYIRIPWMFRLPPDEQRQAEVIIHRGIQTLSPCKFGLITSTDHDGRTFAAQMLAKMEAEQISPVFHFQISLANSDLRDIIRRATSFSPNGVIVRLPVTETLNLLDLFRSYKFQIPIFIPWVPGLGEDDLKQHYDGNILYLRPFSVTANPAYAAFARTYKENYQVSPEPCAAYTYDAVNILIHSLEMSGLNRADLRKAIAGIGDFQGVTGKISWDNGGGNQAEPLVRTLFGQFMVDKLSVKQ